MGRYKEREELTSDLHPRDIVRIGQEEAELLGVVVDGLDVVELQVQPALLRALEGGVAGRLRRGGCLRRQRLCAGGLLRRPGEVPVSAAAQDDRCGAAQQQGVAGGSWGGAFGGVLPEALCAWLACCCGGEWSFPRNFLMGGEGEVRFGGVARTGRSVVRTCLWHALGFCWESEMGR